MVKCLECGRENHPSEELCRYCGHDLKQDKIIPEKKKSINKLLLAIVAVIVILFVLLSIYSNNDNIVYSAGTYDIGTDMPAGDYKYIQTDPTGTECAVQIFDNKNNDSLKGAYETNHKGASIYLHVDDDDTVVFKSGSLQSANNSKVSEPDEKGEYYDGVYKSGFDFEAGKYQVTKDTTGLNTNGDNETTIIISNNPEYRKLDLNFLYEQLNFTDTSISSFDYEKVSFNNESQIDTIYENGTIIMKDNSIIHTFLDGKDTYTIDIPDNTYVFIGNGHIKKV